MTCPHNHRSALIGFYAEYKPELLVWHIWDTTSLQYFLVRFHCRPAGIPTSYTKRFPQSLLYRLRQP